MCILRMVLVLILGLGLFHQPGLSAAEETIYRLTLPGRDGDTIGVNGTSVELMDFARTFEDRGDLAYARLTYEHLIKEDPGNIRAYLLLGRLYQERMEQYVKAIKYYRQAERLVSVSRNPGGKALCQKLIGETYRALAEKSNSLIYFVQAIGEYQKILAYNPDDYEAMYYLASCRMNTRDFGRALILYEHLVDRAPDSDWAALAKQAVPVAKKEYQKSLRDKTNA